MSIPKYIKYFFNYLFTIAVFFLINVVTTSIEVAASYSSTVQSEGNVLYYWPMNEAAGASTLSAATGTTAITIYGATAGSAGQVGSSVSFNGTSNYAATAGNINLSSYNNIAVEALLYIPSYTSVGRLAWELSPNFSNFTDTFYYAVDGGISGTDPLATVAVFGDVNYSLSTYNRFSTGSWHHVTAVYDKSLSSNEVDLYVDGILLSSTGRVLNGNNTNNFGNRVLYLMSRAGSSLFTSGKMQHLAIYNNLATSTIASHASLAFQATALTLSGSATGTVGNTSTNFSVNFNGTYNGSTVVTLSDGGAGGTFSPTSLTLSSSTGGTFSYISNSTGTRNISITNDGGLDNPSAISYSIGYSGLVLGDSTIASYLAQNPVSYYLYSNSELNAGWSVTSTAYPGDTIAMQKTKYLLESSRTTVDYTIVQVGLNDLNPAELASVAIARLQDLVDTINSNKKVGSLTIISTMTPAKQRLIDVYGATNGAISYQKWLDMNDAIKGLGLNPITGVGHRISNHTTYLNDGSGNLAVSYDMGDHIHENNTARQIIAHVWRDVLAELNILQPTTSSQPINVTATAGDSTTTVAFEVPQFNGGATITGYIVSSSPSGGVDSNTGSTSTSHIITGLTNGVSYSFYVTAVNSVGYSTTSSNSNSVTPLDATAPVTSDNVDSQWHNSDITITLTCSDSSSGCDNTWYSLDGSTPTTSSLSGTSTLVSTDGVYTLKYFSRDVQGNYESVKTATNTIKLDKNAPSSVGAVTYGTITTTSIEIVKPSSVTESGSGLNQWQIRRDSLYLNSLVSTTTNSVVIESLSPNTMYYFDVRFLDMASNTSSYGVSTSLYTAANIPSSLVATVANSTQVSLEWSGDASQYYVENITSGENSGWQSGVTKNFSSLQCNTQYSFRVKGKNGDQVETGWSSDVNAMTNGCGGGSTASNPPLVAGFSDNNGIETNYSNFKIIENKVLLNFNVTNAMYVAVSDVPDFFGASWEKYNKEMDVTSLVKKGKIYVKFRSSDGGVTKVFVLEMNKQSPVISSGQLFKTTDKNSKLVIKPLNKIYFKTNDVLKLSYSYKNNTSKIIAVKLSRTVVDKKGKVVINSVGSARIKNGKTFINNVSQSLRKLSAGTYTTTIKILDSKGRTLASNSFDFVVTK